MPVPSSLNASKRRPLHPVLLLLLWDKCLLQYLLQHRWPHPFLPHHQQQFGGTNKEKKVAIEVIVCARKDFIACSELLQPVEKERWLECFDTAVFGDNEDKTSIEFLRTIEASETAKNILEMHTRLNSLVSLFERSSWWKDSDGWNMNGVFQSI